MLTLSLRVYGILRDSKNQVLLSDEFIRGDYFTKFPGGGLEIGEGTRDCLKREFKEETNLDVIIGDHIYTTDYYQVSAFNKNHQIISVYYWVYTNEPIALQTKTKLFDFTAEQTADNTTSCEVNRWINWYDLNEETVSLPIDKIVVNMIKNPSVVHQAQPGL